MPKYITRTPIQRVVRAARKVSALRLIGTLDAPLEIELDKALADLDATERRPVDDIAEEVVDAHLNHHGDLKVVVAAALQAERTTP